MQTSSTVTTILCIWYCDNHYLHISIHRIRVLPSKISDLRIGPIFTSDIIQGGFGGRWICLTSSIQSFRPPYQSDLYLRNIQDGFRGRWICLNCILLLKVLDLHISPTSNPVIIQDGFGGRRICLTCIITPIITLKNFRPPYQSDLHPRYHTRQIWRPPNLPYLHPSIQSFRPPYQSDLHPRYHTRRLWRSPNLSYLHPPLKISDLHISLTSTFAIIQDECGVATFVLITP